MFRNSCCRVKRNNDSIYVLDYFEEDYSELTSEYGCQTGQILPPVFKEEFIKSFVYCRMCVCFAKSRSK